MNTMKKWLMISSLVLCAQVNAAKFKVGVLAPEGTNWAKNMKKMAKEIKTATKGDVKFKFYFGGSQGDEVDVLRKVRINQLQGGVFTGKTLGEIEGDIRVMEIPFLFGSDREKAWSTLEKLGPYFDKKLDAKKFKNLGFFEIGMVYFVSQKKTPNLASLSGVKIWSWEGDRIVSEMMKTLNLVSIPLPLPDVLSSLSTGVIEATYSPLMAMVALQWNTKIKYLVDFPIAYSVGAFLLSDKSWKKIKPEHRKVVREISDKYMAKINEANISDNTEALKAIKASGVEFINFPEADVAKAKGLKEEMIKNLKGKLFTEEALNKLKSAM